MTKYQGLARGPIDHDASSIINAIADSSPVFMGEAMQIVDSPANETLPRVEAVDGSEDVYGFAVGGDADGIYAPTFSIDPRFFAVTKLGQGVELCTQGRCLSLADAVSADINVGDPLKLVFGLFLDRATSSGDIVVARALSSLAMGEFDMIPIDVQREGPLP